ncbi:MAG: acyloxyacyl hydrolase [Saprospiraceae bacterium]|nr:acyloxyacyl hydrolase [Saprospiraceae bacterium]HMW38153.1 acyloxyacyl hydrolase [Saprospiraceae bacterium]HMX87716.1 acyloxyacyl hydrolase [Saprospiraceae bacterium]HMZ39531.1 acyloxyacyl hydrolase [Saprospiraceae bacterium]HNA63096.1 acyloxyacyl hydrolase [Saprospiraceae bacterium]
MIRIVSIFCATLLIYNNVNCQDTSWHFRSGIQCSKLLVHTPKFGIKPHGIGSILDLAISKSVNPKKYPYNSDQIYAGALIKYFDLGQPSNVLGDAYGLVLFYDFRYRLGPLATGWFLIGSGLSYNQRIYHFQNNPQQNAISTHLNNMTTFEWRVSIPVKQSFNIYSGIALCHISNGAFKSPNLGLNYINILLGVQSGYIPRSRPVRPQITNRKMWMFACQYGLAWTEHKVPGGPKFKIDILDLQAGRFYCPIRIMKAGLEAEYHSLSAYFAERSETKPDIQSARSVSYRLHVFGAHEWIFGPTTLETRLGYQFLQNTILAGIPLYVKLIFQYHYRIPYLQGVSGNVGIALKAHYGNAEYISVSAGIRYRKIKS